MKEPVAPYVTPWTGETRLPAQVVITASEVAYADPVHDALARDVDGVLWELCGGTATGRPDYAELHPGRQRETMENLRCAGCNEPAARDGGGMLWLLPLLDAVTTSWEGVRTAIPPVCEACAEKSPRLCPELRGGHVQLRVREAELVGVRGTLHPRLCEPGVPKLVQWSATTPPTCRSSSLAMPCVSCAAPPWSRSPRPPPRRACAAACRH